MKRTEAIPYPQRSSASCARNYGFECPLVDEVEGRLQNVEGSRADGGHGVLAVSAVSEVADLAIRLRRKKRLYHGARLNHLRGATM